MDGLERVYSTGWSYASSTYDPRRRQSSLWMWIIAVASSLLLVDYLMGFRLFRWIYVATIAVIALLAFYGRDPR